MPRLLRLLAAALAFYSPQRVAADDGSVFDKASDVVKEIGEATVDTIDWVLCWFGWNTLSGRPCNGGLPADDGLGCRDELLEGTLDKFCGEDFVDKVLYCPCCADHLLNDLPRRASLLVPGKVTETVAWVRTHLGNECRQGRIRAWALGGDRVPIAWCDRERLVCSCGNEAQGWREQEPACRPGADCSPPAPPEETHAALLTPLAVGDRVRAIEDIEYAALAKGRGVAGKDPCQQAKEAAKGAGLLVPAGSLGSVVTLTPTIGIDWDDFDQLNNAVAFRTQIMKLAQDASEPGDGDHRPPSCVASPPKRVSVGRARCEDMSVDQCPTMYAWETKGKFHYCEVDPDAVRTCRGTTALPQDAQAEGERWQKWAVQWAYNPDLDWKVDYSNEHVFRVNETVQPGAKELQDLLTRANQDGPKDLQA